MKLCQCGCGQEVSKEENRFICGHNSSDTMKEFHRNWKKEDPEDYRVHQSKAGKIGGKKGGKRVYELYPEERKRIMKDTMKKYPNMPKENRKKILEKNPNFFSDIAKKMHKDFKENNPEGYRNHQVEASKKARESIRKNKPHIWKGVHFMSKEEMDVAKRLLTEPIVNINCHIKINGKVVDFFPQENDLQYQGCFVEYHPWDWNGRTEEEYYNDRKEVIDNSEFKGTPLFVLTDMEDILIGK